MQLLGEKGESGDVFEVFCFQAKKGGEIWVLEGGDVDGARAKCGHCSSKIL